MPTSKTKQRKHSGRNIEVAENILTYLDNELLGYVDMTLPDRFYLAHMILASGPPWDRAHATREGYSTFHYRELVGWFGWKRFQHINASLSVFEVTPWDHASGMTKAYRLTPHVAALREAYMHTQQGLTHILRSSGKQRAPKRIRTQPKAIASQDSSGQTQTVWQDAGVLPNIVAVDVPRLQALYSQYVALELSAFKSVKAARWHLSTLAQFLKLASTHAAGDGNVGIRYSLGKTGRLFAEGVSLQTIARPMRAAALHGMWDYDIQNCHYNIFLQLLPPGCQAPAVQAYINDRDGTRQGIIDRVGITKDETKMCLLAIMYGARKAKQTRWAAVAIPDAIGDEAADRLYKDYVFSELMGDLKTGRSAILKHHEKGRTHLTNAVGMRIKLTDPPQNLLAHIIQGIEVKALRAVHVAYPGNIKLLMHDGWVSKERMPVEEMEHLITRETGFRLPISEVQLSAPRGTEITKLA